MKKIIIDDSETIRKVLPKKFTLDVYNIIIAVILFNYFLIMKGG